MSISLLTNEAKGTLYATISGLLYGLLGYFGMSLMQAGFSSSNVSFWRFFAAFSFLLVVFIFSRQKLVGSLKDNLLTLLNGAIFYGSCGNLFLIASNYIGTGQTIVIFFVFPVFVMLLNRIFLKQRIKPHYYLSFSIICAGLITMVDISEITYDFLGIALSLISALSYAISIFLSKNIRLPSLQGSLLIALGCMITGAILSFATDSFVIPSTTKDWGNIFSFGIITTALPILFLFEALKHISSDKVSLLSVLEPVFVVIFGVILLGEIITVKAFIGITLTLLGAVLVSINWEPILQKRVPNG